MDPAHTRRRFIAMASAMSALHLVPPGRPTLAGEPDAADSPNASTAADPAGTMSGEIDADTIERAERIAGIRFTDPERRMMAGTIAGQTKMFRSRRDGIDLPEHLFPATVFNPLLPGRTSEPTTATGDPNHLPAVRTEPGDPSDIDFASIAQLGSWLRSGAVSSVELTVRSLDRLKTHGTTLECVVNLLEERSMKQARRADEELARGRDRGPLHGIPWGAKDLFDTVDAPTTWGATPYRDRRPERDATVIRRLDDAGAILVAKLTLGALAYGDIWFGGRTRNPWNLEEGSSGSSAGSAAATAAGLVGFTLGTETCGSIVSPAMRCGAVGLRPTFGRVPRDGAMALCWSLDKVGPIVRHVDDAAPVLAAVHGASPGDPASVSRPFHADSSLDARGLRVGYDPRWFQGSTDAALEESALDALDKAGCRLIPIELPDWPWDALFSILLAESAAAFESLTRGDLDDDLVWQDPQAWPNTFRQSWFIPAPELVQADRFRRRCMQLYAELFENLDAMIGPSYAEGVLITTNCTGHPSLTVPVGRKESGSPHAITLIGRLFDEGTLLRIGNAVDRHCWPAELRRPPLTTG